ncbi:PIN domain-containing protein [Halolamina sp. C58]|uniref:PIN domain-containing protein n=1 Tax=Halolamina sp. C58 TaxID=3421640 RepID=UPI003EC01D8F
MIYDTSYFLDLTRRGDPDAFRKGVELFEAGVVRRVPVQVHFELFYGVEVAGVAERRQVENALNGYPTVGVDERIARIAGRLYARHQSEGVDWGDCYIGATAKVYDEPVLTGNPEDFEALGVDVETY